MSTLEKAIALAAKHHEGQTDKAGKPYIFHVLKVMMDVEKNDEMIVAVLHDILEDTSVTIGYLREQGFDDKILSSIVSLTKFNYESYDTFINRVCLDPLAARVKLADICHNRDLKRLTEITDEDVERIYKYDKAYAKIYKTLNLLKVAGESK